MKNKQKKILFTFFGAGLLCILFFAIFLWGMFGDFVTYGTNLKALDGIPPVATDINYYRNKNISGLYLCDFKISEQQFINFAMQKKWKLGDIENMEEFLHAKPSISNNPNNTVRITNGLYYSKRNPNGSGISVAYDRLTGRGYILQSDR